MTLCCLLALPGRSQYIKAKKGDVVPFREAVITNRPTFELETRKIHNLEQIVDAQINIVENLETQVGTLNLQLEGQRAINKHTQQELDIATVYIQEQNSQLTRAIREVEKNGRWYNKNSIWAIVGAGIAILLIK